jgi:GDP-L-fucose synthase
VERESKIFVAGHGGMVGSVLFDKLIDLGYPNLYYERSADLDLRNQFSTQQYINKTRPEYIFLIAGKVGGIQANIKYPGEYLYDNLMISANVIEAARINGVKKLLLLGSSCIYPRLSKQPMKEEYLLQGALEPTNEGYAIGKIAGLKLCEYYDQQYGCNFISVMPPNIYGPRDNYMTDDSHVISALIKRIHHAKTNNIEYVDIWGSGSARREFMYNDDVADGLLFLMNKYSEKDHINLGSGTDITIYDLACTLKEIIEFQGTLRWDKNKPDGMPRKLMDSSRLKNLGWSPRINLFEGLSRTYSWYLKSIR